MGRVRHRLGHAGEPSGWLVLAAALVGLGVTADVLAGGMLTRFDHDVARLMGDWDIRRDPWPMRLTYLLTLFGQRGTVLVLTVPTVGYLSWRARSVDPALRYLLALLILTASVYAGKALTARSAPPVDALHTAAGASFPSGHIANAIIVWGTVAWSAARVPRAPDRLQQSLAMLPIVAPVAVFVGMTILDYHWFTDFVAGACVGIVGLRVVQLSFWQRGTAALDHILLRPPS